MEYKNVIIHTIIFSFQSENVWRKILDAVHRIDKHPHRVSKRHKIGWPAETMTKFRKKIPLLWINWFKFKHYLHVYNTHKWNLIFIKFFVALRSHKKILMCWQCVQNHLGCHLIDPNKGNLINHHNYCNQSLIPYHYTTTSIIK